MSRRGSFVVVAAAGPLGLMWFLGVFAALPPGWVSAQPAPQKIEPPKIEPQSVMSPGQQAVMANVKAFTEGFNRRDVVSLLKLFTDDCVLTEYDGSTARGVKELETELKESFESDPEAKIGVSVDSLREVAPGVIVEEGTTSFYPDGKTLTAETEYQATHVKKGDQWLMAQVRSFNRVVISPYDKLRELEWLVGDWIDEGGDSIVESSYRWDANKAFLLQDFTIRIKGKKALTGSQRIGRDPLTKQIKGWVFDSAGGYAENSWLADDDGWTIKMQGVRADGKVVSAANQITRLDKDRMRFDSERIVGDERSPAFTSIVVRRPPTPGR